MIQTSKDFGYWALLEEIIKKTIVSYSSPQKMNSMLLGKEKIDNTLVLKKYYKFIDEFCDIKKNKWAQFMLDIKDGVDIYKILRQAKWMAEEQIYRLTKNEEIRPTPEQNKEVRKMLKNFYGEEYTSGRLNNTHTIKSMTV